MDKIDILKSMINHSKNIVFFTGAGISVPSGIPDFRSAKGVYDQPGLHGYSAEEIISHTFYMMYKKDFYSFYKKNMMFPTAIPNLAHTWISDLAKSKNVTVVTQNIDGLHQKAGSENVFELHGSIWRNYCEKCHKFYDGNYIYNSNGVPKCSCGGDIKPDVVLYEEGLDENVILGAIEAISRCDTLVVIGTSLSVYPAASFIRYFKGNALIFLNKEKTNYNGQVDLEINDDIVNIVKELYGRKN